MLAKLKTPIAVVAHDAGAANQISAWLGPADVSSVYGSFGGPAKEIFGRQCPWMTHCDLGELLRQSRTLISGTGWSSALEHNARKLAKQLGCHTIAVIDHWTNYRARFVREGEEVLPDEIWVADEYAKRLAEAEFPGIEVVQCENAYLEQLVREVRQHEQGRTASSAVNILYVLEPIREAWGSGAQPGEFQALDFFVANMGALGLQGTPSIKLRPHPSDFAGKFDDWIESQKDLHISLDASSNLAESVAWADVVAGCHTYAMVVALAAGKQVISSVPSWAPPCVLPQTGIVKLSDLVQ